MYSSVHIVHNIEFPRMNALVLLLAVLLYSVKAQQNTTDEKYYTYNAAIVEYNPSSYNSLSLKERATAVATAYISLLDNVTEDIDLILFPESTLGGESTEVPEPFTEIICNSTDTRYEDYLKDFSCAAIEHNTTVVINIVEKENCTLKNSTGFCPSSGIVYYNADIAFNESGGVSGKYHKWNLFGEYQKSPPAEVELTVITTKNNNSFGIFTCFDILFDEPALNLTKNLGLMNILFPTMWFSELPFLTALQVQQMWAEENNVNLLSAGANSPSVGSGGTGVFVGNKGPSEYAMIGGSGGTRLIIKTVPKLEIENNPYTEFSPIEEDVDSIASEMDSFRLKSDSSIINDANSTLLDTSKTTIAQEVCAGDTVKICCEFNVIISINETLSNATEGNQYVYHLVAYDDARTFDGVRDGGIELCGILACLNDSRSSCGQRFSNYSDIVWPITFENISVSATFANDATRIQFPNSLLASIRPLSPQYTRWDKEETDGIVKRTHSITRSQNRLLTFGIYGRDFSRDSPVRESTSGASSLFFTNISKEPDSEAELMPHPVYKCNTIS
ncbi:hypothetical protein NQ317_017334 [Molorchus minor]|uniref:CN hydrolase domain-containing protein n=1 Tax=Molorchus minor TaxID=1323400 RepID=A0ABQ9K1C7_9CUCU|nr:hypothetical protein NQ317_017334 [Molorchus minor]